MLNVRATRIVFCLLVLPSLASCGRLRLSPVDDIFRNEFSDGRILCYYRKNGGTISNFVCSNISHRAILVPGKNPSQFLMIPFLFLSSDAPRDSDPRRYNDRTSVTAFCCMGSHVHDGPFRRSLIYV